MLLSSTVITKYIIFQLFFFSVHYSGATLEKHWSTLTRWWKLVSKKLRFVYFLFFLQKYTQHLYLDVLGAVKFCAGVEIKAAYKPSGPTGHHLHVSQLYMA